MLIEPIALLNTDSLPTDYYEFFHIAFYFHKNMNIWEKYFNFDIKEYSHRKLVFNSLLVKN